MFHRNAKSVDFYGNIRRISTAAALAVLALPVFAQTPVPAAIAAARQRPLSVRPVNRVPRQIDGAQKISLRVGVAPEIQKAADLGDAPGATFLKHMILSLKRTPEQQAALDAYSDALQDPQSPYYHQWLTPQTFGEHFGLSTDDVNSVAEWLRSQGFTVDATPDSHWTIEFSGSVAQANAAFGSAIHAYDLNGETHHANSREPQIPAALSGIVEGISGLQDFPPHPTAKPAPQGLPGFSPFIDPQDLSTIYNAKPLYSHAIDGTGVKIAVIAPCTLADGSVIAAFRTMEGLPTSAVTITNVGSPAICSGGNQFETFLDLEWAGSIANKAQVQLVSSDNADALLGAAQNVIQNNSAQVMSISYLSCESAYHQVWISMWQQAATQGITGFVSSGDTGAAGCDQNTDTTATHGLAVNGYCASQYVVCVGGTMFNEGTGNTSKYWTSGGRALSYIPEVAWNESSASETDIQVASGGGYSTLVAKPSWQTGTNAQRGIPDVALSAASHDGYRVCSDVATCASTNSISIAAGTSVSAPSVASMIAMLIQATGDKIGSPNQQFYKTAAQSGQVAFNDITSGNNKVAVKLAPFTLGSGWDAAPGWDPVTGLGSLNLAGLIGSWPGVNIPGLLPSVPVISSLLPSTVIAGTRSFSLVISGSSFTSDAVISFNGTNLTTGFTSSTQIGAVVPASMIASAGTAIVAVTQGGGTAQSTLTITPAVGSGLSRIGVLSQLAAGGGWDTAMYLTNTSSFSVSVALLFNGDDGTPMSIPVNVTQQGTTKNLLTDGFTAAIAANTTLVLDTGTLTGLSQGWADVLSSGPVTGFAVFRYAPGGLTSGNGVATPWEGTVPLQTDLTETQITIPYDNTGGFGTGVAIGNLTSSTGTFVSTFYDSTGNKISQQSGTLPATGHTAFLINAQYPFTANTKGTLIITGPALMGLGLRASPYGTLTSVPLPLSQSGAASPAPGLKSRVGVLSQLAAGGGGWDTAIYLTNTTSNPASVTLSFNGDNGSPLTIPFTSSTTASSPASTISVTIQPNTTFTMDTTSLASDPLLQGWVDVQSNIPITGFAVFRYAPKGLDPKAANAQPYTTPWEGTVSLQADLLATSMIVPFDNTNKFETGFAIGNLTTSSGSFTVNFYDDNGTVLGSSQPLVLAASAHTAFMIDLQYSFTANKRGVAKITGSGLMGVGLRASPYGTLTSLPLPLAP